MSVNAAVLVALVLALSAPVQDRPANPPVEPLVSRFPQATRRGVLGQISDHVFER